MYNMTLKEIINDAAKNGSVKNVTDAVGYLAGYLDAEHKFSGRVFDAVIVLTAIENAAKEGIIEW